MTAWPSSLHDMAHACRSHMVTRIFLKVFSIQLVTDRRGHICSPPPGLECHTENIHISCLICSWKILHIAFTAHRQNRQEHCCITEEEYTTGTTQFSCLHMLHYYTAHASIQRAFSASYMFLHNTSCHKEIEYGEWIAINGMVLHTGIWIIEQFMYYMYTRCG
jgi:hypothetical protein